MYRYIRLRLTHQSLVKYIRTNREQEPGQVLKYFKYFKIKTFELKYLILKHF